MGVGHWIVFRIIRILINIIISREIYVSDHFNCYPKTLPPNSSYLIINDWNNSTGEMAPKPAAILFSWNNTVEYSQQLSHFQHNNFRIDKSCSTVFNGSMMVFGGLYNPKKFGVISTTTGGDCGIKVFKNLMPVEMNSHSCVNFQSSVLLCGTPKNETICMRLGHRFFFEIYIRNLGIIIIRLHMLEKRPEKPTQDKLKLGTY